MGLLRGGSEYDADPEPTGDGRMSRPSLGVKTERLGYL